MRSLTAIRQEIRLRQQLDEAAQAAIDSETEWDAVARQSNRRALKRLGQDLSDVQGLFEWSFSGLGVYDHSITLTRLTDVCSALGQTMRWTARDLALLEGRPVTSDFTALVEPVVTSTFDSSFGLRVAAPPIVEHPEMFLEGTLFERTTERVLAVFKAAASEDAAREVVTLLTGLRRNAIAGFKTLTQRLAEAGAPTSIRWRGDTVWTVSTSDAEVLFTTLSAVEPVEEELPITGVLVGGDSDAGQFHIVLRRVTGDRHFRGKTEEGVDQQLEGLTLGTTVNAMLLVVRVDSPFMQEPKETYLLRRIVQAPIGG